MKMLSCRWLAVAFPILCAAACSGEAASSAQEAVGTVAKGKQQASAKVLFTIGVHIEPFGAEVSDLVPGGGATEGQAIEGQATKRRAAPPHLGAMNRGSKAPRSKADRPPPPQGATGARPPRDAAGAPPARAPGPRNSSQDYNEPFVFESYESDLEGLLAVVERHGGKAVLGTQSPFTDMVESTGSKLFSNALAKGHEIGLHFHEDAHLGSWDQQTQATWTAVMKEQVDKIAAAGGGEALYWSGGNLYEQLLDAAYDAGLRVNGDYKNPATQSTDERMLSSHPWRPSGGCDGTNIDRFVAHDPKGQIVFLPEGPVDVVASKQASKGMGPDGNAYQLDAVRQQIEAAVAGRDPDKVNVVHFTLHPKEFDWERELEPFLAEVVDPQVEAGTLAWATLTEQYEAYLAWESAQ